ncbi:ATP-independent periplasmic protein-refolding chaperone Spy [Klebsiella sp. BIGb0407]|uniref:ATP-independent periplasmic protein-refolding chaperone Spy n=1 Tax=Klebsiella sp. BIGb0407 TaxID=2940603 RepID=UPI0021686B81|nr:ATP-independent periplasmic protein-refolding chaperone Spy [Klebsiella sp. BIGb0407]MCS3429585.1 Spy/CpxP family protein refolding chaperone [Klebsiella sp. BIGb0407]
MRKITALFVASTLALGAVNLAHAAEATPADNAKIDAPAKHHKGGRDGEHGNMFKGLNLTDAQKQQIRTIMQEKHGQMKGNWQQDKRGMHDLVASDSFDKAKAQEQVDKMAENYKVRMLSHLENQNKIYNILTPEQKKQFNDKFEKRLTERSGHQDKMAANR